MNQDNIGLDLGAEECGHPAVYRFLEDVHNDLPMSEPLAHTLLSIISVTHYEQGKLDGIVPSEITYKDYMNAA